MQNKKVYIKFINQNGIEKEVFVYVDSKTYEILPKLNEKDRTNYLMDLYHEQERERNYRRKTIPFSQYIKEDDKTYDPIDNDYDLETSVMNKQLIKEILNSLSPKDKVYINLYFFESLTKAEIADRLNVNRKTVYRNINRIIKNLQDKFNN